MTEDIFSRWTNLAGKVTKQVTSGRWILTIASTYCLILLTQTLCKLMETGKITLEAATYVAIIMAVLNTISSIVMFYFNKNRPTDDGNSNTTG
jgi:hypothetical protein